MTIKEFLLQPFVLGLALGLVFTGIALWRMLRLRLELGRFKRHLSERLELDAESVQEKRRELGEVRKENEQLRIRVAALGNKPGSQLQRELEIYARAEKQMVVNAPGFAAAWENAKTAAAAEMEQEDAGKSLPKRIFRRWFGLSAPKKDELPDS